MVLKRRQQCGFNTFQFPFVPRAPRSARRRVLHKKKVADTQICAFEVLASLAGKLLQESESSSASSIASGSNDQLAIGDDIVKQDQGEYEPLKTECIDQGSYDESVFVPEFTSVNGEQKFLLKESPHAESDLLKEHSSAITNSGSSEKASSDVKSMTYKISNPCENIPCKSEGGSLVPGKNGYVTNGFNGRRDVGGVETGNLITDNKLSSKFPMESCTEFHALVSTDNKVKLPPCRDPVPNASILRHRNGYKLGIRDDDEKFSRYNNQPRVFRPPSRIGDRRIRKLLTSKYWKVASKLKHYELSNVDGVKPLYRKRKIGYSRGRYQHDAFCKRRKFSDNSLVVNSDGGLSSESVCNSRKKENVISSSTIGCQASFNSRDSRVRFGIKSFRIPELFIEVPDDTTVGSLKRRVLETVTAILGGGLRVGVVFHGKKVRDDNRTLLQSGITSKDNLDTLGFTLEPSPGQTPLNVCPEDTPVPISCDTSQIVSRSPTARVLDSGFPDATPDPSPLTNLGDKFDCNHESTPPIADKLTEKTVSDSRALVAVPPASVDALAVVPLNRKTKRSELVQRRTRRPFSVSEVEALVQAVEELGTGRWRDVKLRSFENADHRTYVDLKDKWKTLVHTAKIAPQQRRGEPVPQELLDRVLAAHAYWSQHQAKQHSKSQAQAAAVLKISDSDVGGRNGVEGITM